VWVPNVPPKGFLFGIAYSSQNNENMKKF
jgi:hypothetical protein